MTRKLYMLLLLMAMVSSALAQTTLKGRITSTANGEPIAFATIYAREVAKGTTSAMDGNYVLALPAVGRIHLQVSCLGYHTREVVLEPGVARLDIKMDEQSVGLEEVSVTASYRDKMGSGATIEQEALEYIQPTSLKDVFALLPGGKAGDTNMQNSTLISSRQVGSDASTSFGMGLTVNGVPVQNDGMRIQMSNVTGNSEADNEGNVSINTGVDLRSISTDHIQSVAITRGISSAKEGNLSSGNIQVNAKQGVSPLQGRVKFDPLNKLAYIGRGFALSESLGTLYAGVDVVRSQAAISDARGAYNRVSAQLNWNNQRKWFGRLVDMNVLGSYVSSFSNNKTDEMIETFHEKYNSRYQRASLSAKFDLRLDQPWIDHVELIASADYTQNVLRHHKHVINRSIMPLQQSKEEGEHEGVYLPSSYDTFYRIANQPINVFAQLNAEKFGKIGNRFNYTVLLGTTFNYTKNVGIGVDVDPERPPFPSEDFIRPRKNSDIPALVNQAGYLETKIRYRHASHELNASLGIRETMMANLPSYYYLQHRMLWDPRMQAAYTFYHAAGDHTMSHTLRVGYGVENKLPSADFLYPDKVYHDFIALNAYFTDESKRLLITNTKIQNPENPRLRANKNMKLEAGYDLRCNGYELSVTVFDELMKGGIEYFTTYTPTSYTYYYELKHPTQSKPTRDDFYSREMRTFMAVNTPTNSARTEKRGLEYRIRIPTIKAIRSEVELNGAYYHTVYSNGVPVMYRPSLMVGDQMYPYVGIYDGYDKQYASNFNTNLWVNTHLSRWKLIFTNFIQVVWFQESHLSTDVDDYPERYMDTNGDIHQFNLADDPQLVSLKRSFMSSRYNRNRRPVSLLWNIKATKEFSRHVKLSFFCNNIVQVSPKYKNGYSRTTRDWHSPFFGAELTMAF